eukprot:182097-Chlamydomonas_euryale.AAC.1
MPALRHACTISASRRHDSNASIWPQACYILTDCVAEEGGPRNCQAQLPCLNCCAKLPFCSWHAAAAMLLCCTLAWLVPSIITLHKPTMISCRAGCQSTAPCSAPPAEPTAGSATASAESAAQQSQQRNSCTLIDCPPPHTHARLPDPPTASTDASATALTAPTAPTAATNLTSASQSPHIHTHINQPCGTQQQAALCLPPLQGPPHTAPLPHSRRGPTLE